MKKLKETSYVYIHIYMFKDVIVLICLIVMQTYELILIS
jgi:hypothetical protein